MYHLSRVGSFAPFKLLISIVVAIFSPVQVPLISLLTMLFFDTVLGSTYAIKNKKFSSHGARHGVIKFSTYFFLILVVRLVEIGITEFVDTHMLTHAVTTYLILTEGLSVIEKLALLGAPVPNGISSIIKKQLDDTVIKKLFSDQKDSPSTSTEVSVLSTDFTDKLLEDIQGTHLEDFYSILLIEWSEFLDIIKSECNCNSVNNDFMYYKIMAALRITDNKIIERCKKAGISPQVVSSLKRKNATQIQLWKNDIKELCNGNYSTEYKKKKLSEDVQIFLYRIIVEKCEADDPK